MRALITTLITLFFVAACTEKVSEELKDSNQASSASSSSSASASKQLEFKLVHTMSDDFSHYLHDAESLTDECSVSIANGVLSAENYDRTDTDVAKDCFLEVEEMDLFFQGANLKVTADEGMCEYMAFRPFSFWQYQAGRTTKVLHTVQCEDNTCHTECGQTFHDAGFAFSTTQEAASFCHFDHTQNIDESLNPPNCDEGAVTVITYSSTGQSDPNGDGSDADETCTPIVADSEEVVECGGEYTECLAGPAKELVSGFPDVSGVIIYNEDLSPIEEEYEIPSPDSQGYSKNMYIANYMRSCFDTTTPDKSNSVSGLLTHFNADFKGYELEGLRRLPSLSDTDSSGSFSYPTTDANGDGIDDYEIYSTAPFRGAYPTRPYYAFYCFDKAYDIKAQIRLFIRDWDRNFEKTYAFLNKTSDVGNATKLMDTLYGNTGTCGVDMDCYDNDNQSWNNKYDWDDFFQNGLLLNSQCTEMNTLDSKANFPRYNL